MLTQIVHQIGPQRNVGPSAGLFILCQQFDERRLSVQMHLPDRNAGEFPFSQARQHKDTIDQLAFPAQRFQLRSTFRSASQKSHAICIRRIKRRERQLAACPRSPTHLFIDGFSNRWPTQLRNRPKSSRLQQSCDLPFGQRPPNAPNDRGACWTPQRRFSPPPAAPRCAVRNSSRRPSLEACGHRGRARRPAPHCTPPSQGRSPRVATPADSPKPIAADSSRTRELHS